MTTLTLRSATSSPYAVLAAGTQAQPSPQKKRGLLTMSRLAEARTLSAPAGALILAVLQEDRHYTAQTAKCYRILAERGVNVLLFAHGWTGVTQPTPNLHLVELAPDDAARDEWDVLVCTPRRRFGFAALDTHRPAPSDMDRVFGWLTTHDNDAIGRAADALLCRIPTLPVQVPHLAG
jgi:DICT domain-containing protein